MRLSFLFGAQEEEMKIGAITAQDEDCLPRKKNKHLPNIKPMWSQLSRVRWWRSHGPSLSNTSLFQLDAEQDNRESTTYSNHYL